jgi:hypothetical protein
MLRPHTQRADARVPAVVFRLAEHVDGHNIIPR